jgi:hypothetical protein
MNLDIPVTNKIQEDGIEAFREVKKTFNKDYDTVTIAEMEALLETLDSINERIQNVQNIFNPINMN